MSDESLDRWIDRVNEGDTAAMEHVLIAYEPYLRMTVRRRLGRRIRAKVDSQDIVQSVFADVLRGFRKNAWHFAGRPQLLAFLRRVASRRIADRCDQHREALEHERPLADNASQSLADGSAFRPSEVAQGRELWDRILATCPPAHREIVRLRMRGHRLTEIAERTGLHEGSVRRILYELARKLSLSRRTANPGADDGDD